MYRLFCFQESQSKLHEISGLLIQLVNRVFSIRATSESQPGDAIFTAEGRLEPGVVAQGCGCDRVLCGSAPPTKAPRWRPCIPTGQECADLFCLLPVVQPHAECGMRIQAMEPQAKGQPS